MKLKSPFAFALLASTMLTQNVVALTPTIETLKTQGQNLSSTDVFTLTELGSNTLPNNAVKVMVDKTAYYFIPTGDNKDLIKELSGTSAAIITKDSDNTYSISFDTGKLPDSTFSYTSSNETDYNFTTTEKNNDGNLVTKYYKIVLDKSKLGTTSVINFDVVDSQPSDGNYVTLTLPNNQTKYITYTYTKPDTYSTITNTVDISNPNKTSGYVDEFVGAGVHNEDEKDYGNINNVLFQNNKAIGEITSDNYDSVYGVDAKGGAIYNHGTIGNITADFVGNAIDFTTTKNMHLSALGGAIYNHGTIGDINGSFVNNYVSAHLTSGGAIYNTLGTIGNINADFIGNFANSTGDNPSASGGAIHNQLGTIGDITGDFIGNYAIRLGDYGSSYGGAIHNNGTIGNISGNFIANHTNSLGGAIYNFKNISNITGDFIANHTNNLGGAIYNRNGTINNITGNFIENYASTIGSTSYQSYGGAIYNINGTINNITGDFIGNHVINSASYSAAAGGVIFNDSDYGTIEINNISGNFIQNYVHSNYTSVYGGAIANEANYGTINIDNISGNFNQNYVKSTSSTAFGGAISNYSSYRTASTTIKNIYASFNGNYTDGMYSSEGGAIYNNAYAGKASIENIFADFNGNYANGQRARGGAIYNNGDINHIKGNFDSNHASHYSYNSYAYGGAIYNSGSINEIEGDFVNNYIMAGTFADGGAIYNSGNINNITGDFINNSVIVNNDSSWSQTHGGAIYNGGNINNITGNFINNSITFLNNGVSWPTTYGGAIYNGGNYNNALTITNSSFIDNHISAVSNGINAYGGAIYTNYELNIIADNSTSKFSGNYIQLGENAEKQYEAIFVGGNGVLNLIAQNNGIIEFDDYINGWDYEVNITGDESGTLNLYNDIKNANIIANTITINTANNKIHNYVFNTLSSDKSANYIIDLDLTNKTADTIATNNESSGTVTLDSFNYINGDFSDLNEDDIDHDFKIQILKTQNDNLQLSLSNGLYEQLNNIEYKLGTEYLDVFYDSIKAISTWEDVYNKYSGTAEVYATFGLTTTDTTNDSIGITGSKYVPVDAENLGSIGDTLKLLNQYQTPYQREFNATPNATSYTVTEDLGETASGTLSVNGLKGATNKSVIDFDGHSGFELEESTTLNLNDVEIKNALTSNYGSVIKFGIPQIAVPHSINSLNNADSDIIVNINNVDFINNSIITNGYVGSDTYAYGGAIFNSNGTFGDISGSFTQNSVQANLEKDNEQYNNVDVAGGAIFNDYGNIANITADFTQNYVKVDGLFEMNDNQSDSYTSVFSNGGAITNGYNIGDITGNFKNNYAQSTVTVNNEVMYSETYNGIYGGAIYNYGTVGDINGNFEENYAQADITSTVKNGEDNVNSYVEGGAIYNNYELGNIIGNFIKNHAQSTTTINNEGNFSETYSYAFGGAIYNNGTVGDINGNFEENYAQADITSTINSDNANIFTYVAGGAIYNDSVLGNITGDFKNNYVQSNISLNTKSEQEFMESYTGGGAIYNSYELGNISGNFTKNNAQSTVTVNNEGNFSETYSYAFGGAIYNDYGTIGDITGNFEENYVESIVYSNNNDKNYTMSIAGGGAIYNNYGTIGNISGDFIKNHATAIADDSQSVGGAIFNNGADLKFTSNDKAYVISGNYTSDSIRGKNYNAIFSAINPSYPTTIIFDTTGSGSWTINDNIEGMDTYNMDYSSQYNLNFLGDDIIDTQKGTTKQFVAINNEIINAGEVMVEGTTLKFGSYKHEDKKANNWNGEGRFSASLNQDKNSTDSVTSLTLNNAVFDVANGYIDQINLRGFSSTDSFYHIDLNTSILKADILTVDGDISGNPTKLIVHASSDADIRGHEVLFAQSVNDSRGNENSFEVSRVYKSPYLYKVIYKQNSSEPVSLEPFSTENYDKHWYLSMLSDENPNKDAYIDVVAPEVIGSIAIPTVSVMQKSGMVNSIMKSSKIRANDGIWVDTDYNMIETDSIVNVEAQIWGVQAGADIQRNINNKLGMFVSYRNGSYEMDGTGEKYSSPILSEINTKSYLGGLYYQYDNNHWYVFSTIYGGIQKAELETSDNVTQVETDATEFGASIEVGYNYDLSKTVNLTPSLAAYYSQVSYDQAEDNVGKTYDYENIQQVELEAGIKLGKTFENAYIYTKPSVVQTINQGGEVEITNIGKSDTLENSTLGRIEVGGNYGLGHSLSTYGWANHTFGSDYSATSAGIGLYYKW